MSRQLMIMRHAKSSWKDQSLSDHDRPLNDRGLRDAPAMGKFLQDADCLPELILTSTAARAHSTARMLVDAVEDDISIVTQKSLYHPGIDDFCEVIRNQAQEENRVMVVSHNPGSEDWTLQLTGQYESMPTAAIALINLDDDFRWIQMTPNTRGRLETVWRPKQVL